MRTSTYNGLWCDNKGINMCMRWWIFSIPFAQNWVSNILWNIWCSSTTFIYTNIFRTKCHSWISPHLVQHTDMLQRLTINSSWRGDTLDLRTQGVSKEPQSYRENGKVKPWTPKTTFWRCKPKIMVRKINTLTSHVSSIKLPLRTQMIVVRRRH